MPESSHPPYLPTAQYQPRQINRWLDINPQNGPLTRTQTFITLPTFSQAVTWRGYSDLIVAFNYEGPNNFSFKNVPVLANPNFLLCVSWYDSLGNHVRYCLQPVASSVIYFGLPLYNGQLIKKNFRFEVWSVSTSPTIVSNASSVNYYTSVLGDVDYRYGLDSALVNNDPIVTNFVTPVRVPTTLPQGGGYLCFCDLVYNVDFSPPNWTSNVGAFSITSANAELVNVKNGRNVLTGAGTSNALYTGVIISVLPNYIWVLVYHSGFNGNLVTFENNPNVFTTTTGFSCNGANVVCPVPGWYLVYVDFVDGFIAATDINTLQTFSNNFAPPVVVASTVLDVLDAGSTCVVQAVVGYEFQPDSTAIYNYFYTNFMPFTLPLTFPVNSVSQTN